MLDPTRITNYQASDSELQEMLLFWIAAAGKNGVTAAKSIDKLLAGYRQYILPFLSIKQMTIEVLTKRLQEVGIGCYRIKAETIYDVVSRVVAGDLNLRTCLPAELEAIKGIGPKTSRCFILHTRRDADYIGLDRHMLRYLKLRGHNFVPKYTPSNKPEYDRVEKIALAEAKLHDMTPAEFDLAVWNYARTFLKPEKRRYAKETRRTKRKVRKNARLSTKK